MEEEEERREGEKKDMAVWFSITLLLYVSFVLCLCVVSVSLLPLLFRPMPCLTSFTLKTSQINSHYHSMLEWYTVGLCWNPLSLSRSISSSSSSLCLLFLLLLPLSLSSSSSSLCLKLSPPPSVSSSLCNIDLRAQYSISQPGPRAPGVQKELKSTREKAEGTEFK